MDLWLKYLLSSKGDFIVAKTHSKEDEFYRVLVRAGLMGVAWVIWGGDTVFEVY